MQEAKPTVNEDNPIIMTKDKPKKSKRRENYDTELLKDDLRVVVFHPDQQQMVHGKCMN